MPETSERVDWPHLMRLGLGVLRLAPDVFWAMTPAEFRAALEGAGLIPIGGQSGMDGGVLADLMAAYPDRDGGRDITTGEAADAPPQSV